MKELKNIIALILIELVLVLPIASALTITNVETTEITDTSATVKWRTDETADSKVMYGKTTDLGESKYDGGIVTEHSIKLQDLSPETPYYYAVQSSDVVENNNGNFYQFTTTKERDLFLNVELPELYNSDEIDINGTTKPGARVNVYVNDVLKRSAVFDDGAFLFRDVRLNANRLFNNIKITAELDENQVEKSFNIKLDLIAPTVILEPIPELSGDKQISIKGTVNEEVTVEIYVDLDGAGYELKESFTATNTIEKTIMLEDGDNILKIVVFDKAGNEVVFENEILVDSSPVRIIDDNIKDLTPAYIRHVTIRGRVNKPGVDVFVAVNNRTSSAGTWSLSIQDILKDFVKDISEGEKDYHAVSDINGDFEIPIELTDEISFTQEELEELGGSYSQRGIEVGMVSVNEIKIIAIDALGRNDTREGLIFFGRCGSFGYWSVSDLAVSPKSLRADIVQSGNGVFTVTGKLNWNGPYPEDDVVITNLAGARIPVSREEEKELEEHLLRTTPQVIGSPDNKKFIMIFKLGRLPENETYAEKLVEYEMLNFLTALSVRYNYKEYSPIYNEEVTETKTEKLCFKVDIQLEREDISRRFKHSDFLHSTTVNLDNLLKYIDSVLKPTETIMKFNLIGCFGTTVYYWIRVGSLYLFDCRFKNLKEVVDECPNGNCKTSDYQTCYDGMQGLLTTEQAMNYLCDRIVCPAAPSIGKHTELYNKARLTILQGTSSECGSCVISPQTCSKQCEEEYEQIWNSVCLVDWPGSEWEYATDTELDNSIKDQFRRVGSAMSNICTREPPVRVLKTVDEGKYLLNMEEGKTKVTIWEIRESIEETISGEDWQKEDVSVNLNTKFVLPGEVDGKKVIIEIKRGLGYCEKGGECPGTQNVPPSVISKAKELVNAQLDTYVLDPTKGIVVAGRCGCISGVVGFLKMYREMVATINACFKELEERGEKTGGICEQVLTMYVCDLAWSALRCGSLAAGEAVGDRPTVGIGNAFSALGNSADLVSQQIYGRYGSTNFYKVMFTEQQLVHSACMWAFTGDWDMGVMMDSLTESALPALESDGYIHPARRMFQYPDPITGKAVYYYDIGALLISGVNDLHYRLELVCSADNSCYRYNEETNPAGLCDCFSIGEKRIILPGASGTLDFAGKFNYGDIYASAPLNYRFDKARLYWEWTDAQGGKHTGEKLVDITEAAGDTPIECSFDIQVGLFRCKFFIDNIYASILDIEPTKGFEDAYEPGDALRVKYKIEKRSPDQNNNGGVDPDEVVPIFIKMELRNQQGVPIADQQQEYLTWPIEEGITDGIVPLIAAIEKKHFGTIERQGTINTIPHGKVDVVSRAFTKNPSNIRYKIEFKTEKIEEKIIDSCEIFEWEKDAFSKGPITCQIVGGDRVTYGGVQIIFRKEEGDITGSWIEVEATGGTIYKEENCPSEPVDWILKVGLYHAKEDNPTEPTNKLVVVNGQTIEDRVRIKAQCQKTKSQDGYCTNKEQTQKEDGCMCSYEGEHEHCNKDDWCCDGRCFKDGIVFGGCPSKCDGGNGYCLSKCEDNDFSKEKTEKNKDCSQGVCCVKG